ncbi:MAG: catalase family protein [Nostoc sp. JL34]|uniref:catalase family protein n=1 Tax=Nostoc sp. JL34 TaxID=2815397 RepID=UPI001D400FEB|nr:catalase family protein [Nostoc sp. JL34]MBN3885749.1 catalase family protein [Nostoc sp. JL34]
MTNPTSSTTEQEAIIDEIIASSLQAQQKTGPDLRQIHSKSHGLLWGEFIIEPNLPEDLRVGLFKTPQTYPAWIRFSSGGSPEKRGKFHSDSQPDVRGIAIKVMNVEGQKVLDDEEKTQDFILNNYPTFLAKDVRDYADLSKAGSGQLSPERLEELGYAFAILQKIGSQKVGNPLLIQYWSMAPFKFGSRIVKLSVKSQQPEQPPETLPESENYLRETLVKYLTEEGREASFDFLIQFYVDDDKTPIEDHVKEWQEADSPFIKVATVHIPSQKFDFEERKRLDEGILFSPWHTLLDHEPVGSVNLSRKRLYSELAKYRREQISQRSREPQPYVAVED